MADVTGQIRVVEVTSRFRRAIQWLRIEDENGRLNVPVVLLVLTALTVGKPSWGVLAFLCAAVVYAHDRRLTFRSYENLCQREHERRQGDADKDRELDKRVTEVETRVKKIQQDRGEEALGRLRR